MTYRKVVSRQAEKYLRQQHGRVLQRLQEAIDGLPMLGDIKKLKGSNDYRIRIGDMRIIFAMDHTERTVYVKTIDNRKDIYKK